jgi:hypothetical protein
MGGRRWTADRVARAFRPSGQTRQSMQKDSTKFFFAPYALVWQVMRPLFSFPLDGQFRQPEAPAPLTLCGLAAAAGHSAHCGGR